jgi:Ca-activated chloride channel family protein
LRLALELDLGEEAAVTVATVTIGALLGFDLLRPSATVWLLGAGAILLFGLHALRARSRDRSRLIAPGQLARFLPHFAPSRARLRLALAVAASFLLALSLAGPVRGYTTRAVQARGLDLVVCIDTSRSMLVRDLRPDRLTRAKREVRGLLDRLKGDRVALLAFSGDVREVAPLTHDRNTVAQLLDTVSPEENRVGGTDLGAALQRALDLFDGRTGAHEAIVLLTDGEDLEGRGREVAARAGEAGIRIYVVGMGTPQGGKIPEERPDGSEAFVADAEGSEVVSSLDGSTLEQIAEASNGAYLPAHSSPLPLEELYLERVARLEGRELYAGEERIPHDRYQWPLCLAFLCMLVESGLRESRRVPSPRRQQ